MSSERILGENKAKLPDLNWSFGLHGFRLATCLPESDHLAREKVARSLFTLSLRFIGRLCSVIAKEKPTRNGKQKKLPGGGDINEFF